jgi:general secretion pathway protein G
MARRNNKRIFFPWEKRGGFIRRLGLQHARPFIWGLVTLMLLAAMVVRERRATGVRKTRTVMADVRNALDRYLAEHDGRCPSKFSELERIAHFKGIPRDAWGGPLRVVCPSPRGDLPYRLSSSGPDGIPGGLDRIEW